MSKVLKVVKKPNAFVGEKLQEKANRMLLRKQINDEYLKTRKAAEWHLKMWAWERHTPSWQLPGKTSDFDAPACKKVKCPYLPAGSDKCRAGECP